MDRIWIYVSLWTKTPGEMEKYGIQMARICLLKAKNKAGARRSGQKEAEKSGETRQNAKESDHKTENLRKKKKRQKKKDSWQRFWNMEPCFLEQMDK